MPSKVSLHDFEGYVIECIELQYIHCYGMTFTIDHAPHSQMVKSLISVPFIKFC